MQKVLITTSGMGSRLGEFTNHTNKSLVSVGNKPVLSHIIERYPIEIPFVVTLGHYGNHVREYLSIAYPERKFEFVEIDKFEGLGSSLGYSMLNARKYLDCPFIYHAADTLIFEDIKIISENWVGGSVKVSDSSQYTTFDALDGRVSRTHSKGMDHFDFVYVGLLGVFDYKEFWESLQHLYELNPNDSSLNDLMVVGEMLKKGSNFAVQEYKTWRDSGNVSGLKTIRRELASSIPTLEKVDESIYLVGDRIIKFFSDSSVCKKRVQRSLILENLVPKVLQETEHFYSYDFVLGHVFSKDLTVKSFRKLILHLKENLWRVPSEPISSAAFNQICQNFYFDKTLNRLKTFIEMTGVQDVDSIINSEKVPSATRLIDISRSVGLENGVQRRIHGDLILDNIIVNMSSFKLIDWRHEFGGSLQVGDLYYDLAKLNHSLTLDHNILREELYKLDFSSGEARVEIQRLNSAILCQAELKSFIESEGLDFKRVQILTSLIWLNMSPLHPQPLSNWLYYFARYSLFLALTESGAVNL